VLALFDPQTSGGLLIAVAAARHGALLAALDARVAPSWTIGRVIAAPRGHVALRI
jgi:selenophosphate synthase